MLRASAVIAAVLLFAEPVRSQSGDGPTSSSPNLSGSKGMRLERIEAERLGRLLNETVPARLDPETGLLLTPSMPSSFAVEFDDVGQPVVRRKPVESGSPILGDRKALDELLRRASFSLSRFGSPILGHPDLQLGGLIPHSDWDKSVGPEGVKNRLVTVPARWAAAAKSEMPFGIGFPKNCPAAQKAFGPDAESLVGRSMTTGRVQRDRDQLITDARAYDEACLASKSNVPAEILVRLAAILIGAKPYCMAVRLKDNVFLTARHCFHSELGSTAAAPPKASEAVISLLSSPDRTYMIEEVDDPAVLPAVAAYSTRNDLVLVRAKLPSAQHAMPAINFTSPRVAAPAFLVGLYAFHDIERMIPTAPGVAPLPARRWDLSLRATRVEGDVSRTYCRVFDWTELDATETGCLIHACQSVGGFSGSPVFMQRADQAGWELVAVHSSDASPRRLSECETFASKKRSGVVGAEGALAALIPRSVKAAISGDGR